MDGRRKSEYKVQLFLSVLTLAARAVACPGRGAPDLHVATASRVAGLRGFMATWPLNAIPA